MALQLVTQVDDDGCFVAALAMLLGITYAQALKILHPGKDVSEIGHGYTTQSLDRTISAILGKQGFRVKRSTYKKVRSLVKYSKKNALLILRWGGGYLCHAVVFDAETRQFLDPSGHQGHILYRYQSNLDSMYYVEPKAA